MIRQSPDWTFTLSLIGSLLRKYPLRLCIGLAALLIASGSLLSIPKVLGYFIDQNLAEAHLPSLHIAAGVMMAVIALYAAASALRIYMLSWVGDRLVTDIRTRVYKRLLGLPVEFFDTHPTGDLLSRLSSDVALLETMVSIVIPIGLRSGIQLIGALLLMASINWHLTVIILFVGPFLAWIALIFGRKVRKTALFSREGEAKVVMQIEATLNAMSTVKSFSAEKTEEDRFKTLSEANFSAGEKLIRARAFFTFVVFFFALNIVVLVLYFGSSKILDNTMNWSMVIQFIMYVSFAAFSFAGLSEIFSEIKKTLGATERLFQILGQSPETARTVPPVPLPPGKGAIVFDRINFVYPARPMQLALRDFNLSIQPGELIALVGPSGAGKTTVLRLLLRLYDPQTGCITLDGADLRDLEPGDLRRQIAIVSQEPTIFSGTVRDNILYSNPKATDEQLLEASRLAQAHEFIIRLPLGYDTPLGEKGQMISTGQRQRLAIARALVRQPRILLLDEATSAMDSENEMLLRKTFTQYLRGRTMLIVAHRLATVQSADRVVVIENGHIVGQGSHFNLLETCPLYARLTAMEFDRPSSAAH